MPQILQRDGVDGRRAGRAVPGPVAQLLPPDVRRALVSAGQRRDMAMIDALTDELARRGFCRPRSEDTMPLRVDAAHLAHMRGLG